MPIQQQLFQLVGRYVFDRPGRKLTSAQHREHLVQSGHVVAAAIAQARPTPHHQQVARHIIGIERWALVRLAGFHGTTPPADEYDGYQPAPALTLPELADVFRAVRAEIVAMGAVSPIMEQITHNDFGPLSFGGWLRYIELHARIESKKLGK
jgi:hypothetical protein